MKNLILIAILFVTCSFISAGCACNSRSDAANASVLKWKRDPYYRYIFRDSVDRRIKHEIMGEKPTGGAKSWNEFWKGWIKNVSGDPDAKECVEYIIQRRKEAGLPDLK